MCAPCGGSRELQQFLCDKMVAKTLQKTNLPLISLTLWGGRLATDSDSISMPRRAALLRLSASECFCQFLCCMDQYGVPSKNQKRVQKTLVVDPPRVAS